MNWFVLPIETAYRPFLISVYRCGVGRMSAGRLTAIDLNDCWPRGDSQPGQHKICSHLCSIAKLAGQTSQCKPQAKIVGEEATAMTR